MNSSNTKKARANDQCDRTAQQVLGDAQKDKGNGEETKKSG